jgi:S-adenosylmethionine:tRNA ribosyltransferase-isomerase
MNVDEFDFALPLELIAQEPLPERSDSRMMVVNRASKTISHHRVHDLPDFLSQGDVLVMNNTRVIPSRIFGVKKGSGGAVEILFLEEIEPARWIVLCGSNRAPAEGNTLVLADGALEALVIKVLGSGKLMLEIPAGYDVMNILNQYGHMPLPPYIKRAPSRSAPKVVDARQENDRERYQTVYASCPGAAAAPTAGLHFTPELLSQLSSQGVHQAMITLHVSLGTFRPVDVQKVEDHQMDPERYDVGQSAAESIIRARQSGGRVACVGTTSAKTLETIYAKHGMMCADSGASELFIHPPFTFKAVDVLLTNFHLPKSTLLMMISAFAGKDLIMDAYMEAIQKKYRFFSYGDCMLLI